MANGGWYDTPEEWDRLEAPLKSIDAELENFASKNGLQLSKNSKDWPDRSLVWGGTIRCLVQIYLAKQEDLTFNLWICASEDRSDKRFWKREFLKKDAPFSEINQDLKSLLAKAKQQLDHWSAHPALLEFATTLQPIK